MKNYYLFLLLLILSVSCAPVYVAPTLNMPLYEKKGDNHLDVSYKLKSGDINGGIALTDHLMVQGNISLNYHRDDVTVLNTTSNYSSGGVQFDVFGGAYTKMGSLFRAEILGGYGVGLTSGNYYEGIFNKAMGQFNFGIGGNRFMIGFGIRETYVIAEQNQIPTFALDSTYNYQRALFHEWGLNMRFTPENSQLGYTFKTGVNITSNTFFSQSYVPFYIGLGIRYVFTKND